METKPFAQIKTKRGNNLVKVIVRFDGTPTDLELDEYLKTIHVIYQQKVPFVILYDASNIGHISMPHIQKQVDFMREHDLQTSQLMLKCAIVLTSTWQRESLKLIFKIKPPACKQLKVVETFDQAQEFLRQ